MPVIHGDFATIGEVLAHAGIHRPGELRVQCFEVGFQVEAQVPVIEVAGADADPVVHHHQLQMQEALLVFEDAHPGAQQAWVIALAGKAHGRMVGVPAGE
ncbi:hypothetical protein D3C78_1451790 [compost metagenome]